ncbi:hypothetical protein BIW11_11631 [Tropilaelaps mercedesae]|uniref:Chitin-binding type-4 domain-containing protein n=1 Tax=Tropilaelaps mercedesae TaxID=418985 RepID=A0A1V9XAV2_9ACAR|nr:hypothetical protein BIW11_11631 [Tropilaelaps mercedesae]
MASAAVLRWDIVALLCYASLILLVYFTERANSHGRLWEPPSRSTAFRRGFRTPPNYNDNENFCGGFRVMHVLNRGKCGPCGDAWQLPIPRPNEDGGKYGTKTIVRSYHKGHNITAGVYLTANHLGHFEFRLCPEPQRVRDESCFTEHSLDIVEGPWGNALPRGTKRFDIGALQGMLAFKLRLPHNVTCERCVLQWNYTGGNNWGVCPNGKGRLGCGPQEVFRACADISIQ